MRGILDSDIPTSSSSELSLLDSLVVVMQIIFPRPTDLWGISGVVDVHVLVCRFILVLKEYVLSPNDS